MSLNTMSAAKKLKALEAKYFEIRPTWSDIDDAVLAVLPQIIAVVEAADMLANWHQPRIIPTKTVPDLTAAFHATQDALSALEEALP